MSDETEKDEVEALAADAEKVDGPLAGERLAAARREQQITVLEVAKELHLDEPKVRALEQNEFDILGAPVFAKGHLRKYASLVGVDMDDVLTDYYRLNRTSGMPPVVGEVRKPTREISLGPWITAIVIVIIAATAYWWFVVANETQQGPDPSPADSAVQPPDLETTGVADEGFETVAVEMPQSLVDDAVANDTVVDDSLNAESAAEPALIPPPQQSTPVSVPDGQVRLTLNFSGDCWTEISDATGTLLYYDLGRAGRSAEVSGEAPFSVLFGNANNVSVRVNGADYAISPTDQRGETAKLTINNP